MSFKAYLPRKKKVDLMYWASFVAIIVALVMLCEAVVVPLTAIAQSPEQKICSHLEKYQNGEDFRSYCAGL